MKGTKTNPDNYYFTVLVCGNVKCLTEKDSFKNLLSEKCCVDDPSQWIQLFGVIQMKSIWCVGWKNAPLISAGMLNAVVYLCCLCCPRHLQVCKAKSLLSSTGFCKYLKKNLWQTFPASWKCANRLHWCEFNNYIDKCKKVDIISNKE